MTTVISAASTSSYYQNNVGSSPVSVAAAFSAIKNNSRAKFDIVDTAANIEKNLDALKKVNNNLKTLTVSNTTSAVINITAKQMLTGGYSDFLNKIEFGSGANASSLKVSDVMTKDLSTVLLNSDVGQFSIKDSAANVVLKLGDLDANVDKLVGIQLTSTTTPVKISYSQYTMYASETDGSDVLGKLKGTFGLEVSGATTSQALTVGADDRVTSVSIVDNSSSIATNLDALQALGVKVKALASTDNAVMKVNAAQLQSDKAVIGKLYKGYQFAVFNVDSTSALDLTSNKKVVSMDLVDTADNLSRNLVLINRLGSQVKSVRVTDQDLTANPLTMTAVDFFNHGAVLDKVISTSFTNNVADATQSTTPEAGNNNYKLNIVGASAVDAQAIKGNAHIQSISVVDTSAAIGVNLDDLNANGKVTGIAQSGGTSAINITAAQLTADTSALAFLGNENYKLNVSGVLAADATGLMTNNPHVASLSVSDSGANILDKLDDLAQLGKSLTTITQTNPGTSLPAMTVSKWASNLGVLSKIVGGYGVQLSEVGAAQALTLSSDLRVRGMTVKDTAAAISSNLDALLGLGTKLTSIDQSDTGTAIQITGKQYAAYQSASSLTKLGSTYKLDVSSAKANQVAALSANTAHVGNIQVADTVTNIAGNLAALNTAVGTLNPNNIQVDIVGIANAMTLTKTQYLTTYANAMGVINGNYAVKLTDVAAADATGLAADRHVVNMDVTAAASYLQDTANLTTLRALGTKLGGITQTDSTALSMSVTDWTANAGLLEKVKGYGVDLTGATAAGGLNLLTKAHVKSISVTDAADQISINFDKFLALGDSLKGLTTQTGTGNLKLSMSQWNATTSAATRAKLSDTAYKVDISGTSSAQAETFKANDHIDTIGVKDSASNISNKLAELLANTKLTSLQVSDPTAPLKMSMTQYSANTSFLNKIQGGYGLALTGVGTGSLGGGLFANPHVVSAEVQGTASEIQSSGTMTTLNTNSARVKSLKLTDSTVASPATMSFTYSDFQKNKTMLGLIKEPFKLELTGMSASAAVTEATNPQFTISKMSVTDSASQVAFNLDALNLLGAKLNSVKISDVAPVLNISAVQYDADKTVLDKIKNSADASVYQLNVAGVDANMANRITSDSHVSTMTLIDNANTLSNQFDLLSNAKVTTVNFSTDASELSITGAQYSAGTTAASLNKIKSSFSLNVSEFGVTGSSAATSAATLQADARVSQFSLATSDASLANVYGLLDLSSTNSTPMTKLDHISFTSSSVNTRLTVSQDQLLEIQDNQNVNKLTGNFAFNVTGVSMNQLGNVKAMSNIGSVQVTDTSQKIADGWDSLASMSADSLSGIVSTTPSTPVAITMTQWSTSATALADLQVGTPGQKLALLDVLPSQATAASNYANVLTVSVKGTSSEVAAEFTSLNALGAKLDEIEVTDDLTLMLTQAQIDGGKDKSVTVGNVTTVTPGTLSKLLGGGYNYQICD